MNKHILKAFVLVILATPIEYNAQETNDQIGAWYMYFYNTTFKESPWGIQGDLQYRNEFGR